MDFEGVATTIKEVAAQEVTSRFGLLRTSEITEKSPGELVTEADRNCERVLAERLQQIRNIPVVGEESSGETPYVTDRIRTSPAVWLVDPLDGTSNFIAGSTDHAVMVALVEDGATTAAWMWHPEEETMAHATLGGGAWLNGREVIAPDPTCSASRLNGVLKKRFLPAEIGRRVESTSGDLASATEGRNCAGLDYPDLVRGDVDFLIYWRTLPWDHAPGVLLAREAGLRAERLDESLYEPGSDRSGLVVAHPSIWNFVRDRLLADPGDSGIQPPT